LPAFVVALFLAAHGLIHASFLRPEPPATVGGPQWPFDVAHSWLLSPIGLDGSATRVLGIVLIVAILAGYVAAALAFVGIAPAGWFVPGVVVGSVASVVLLALFFHPWLVLGFAIDAVLLWAVLANDWAPKGTF
jgi:hypothetical protein